MIRLLTLLLLIPTVALSAYDPPIGIPDPADYFGVFDPTQTANPDTSTYCPNWPGSASSNCYYIDNSVTCTDSSNTNGYPDNPRCALPGAWYTTVYNAGDYIEVRGGGATYTPAYFRPRGQGTAANPIWFVGVNNPTVSAQVGIGFYDETAEYIVVDGFDFYRTTGGGVAIIPKFDNQDVNHIVVRNSTVRGNATPETTQGVSVGADTFSGTGKTANDIVLYNLDIYGWGDPTDPGEECGVYPTFNLTRFWVLDSDIHDVAEDGLAGSHGGQRTSSFYYIGRNNIYDNITNAIDIKGMTDVIISENTIWGHWDTPESSGAGEAVIIHYGGGDSSAWDYYLYYPDKVAILYNTVYDSHIALATSTVQTYWVVGNEIWGQRDTSMSGVGCDVGDDNQYCSPVAIQLNGSRGNTWIANNTIYDSEGGITIPGATAAYDAGITYYAGKNVLYQDKVYANIYYNSAGTTGIPPTNTTYWEEKRIQIWGNIVTDMADVNAKELWISDATYGEAAMDIDYNDFYGPTGEVLYYGAETPIDLDWLQANSSQCDNCINTDPDLVNPPTDMSITFNSPAKDTSTEGTGTTAYDSFFAEYGINIEVDRAGAARPYNAIWDMGAHEYGADAPLPPNPQLYKTASGSLLQ